MAFVPRIVQTSTLAVVGYELLPLNNFHLIIHYTSFINSELYKRNNWNCLQKLYK
jgi:hypothetical protein